MRTTAALLLATLTLAACSEQAAPPAATNTPAPAAAPATPPAAAPAAQPAAAPAATITGIAECDEFLAAYEQCLSDKMPAEARAQMQVGFDQWKKSWAEMAANEATKASLPMVCQQSRDASKPALQAYGCSL
ncbi:MAG: hypothetical protein IPK27_07980 [Rhodanobacteraceae bacterium]|nr:hypothetical protein [Rhodanobacteraceae bacterium]